MCGLERNKVEHVWIRGVFRLNKVGGMECDVVGVIISIKHVISGKHPIINVSFVCIWRQAIHIESSPKVILKSFWKSKNN